MSFNVRDLWQQKIVAPIKREFQSGESIERLAKSAAAGSCISIFPLFGSSTGLGFLVGAVFKLNHVLLQVMNYAFTSLQLVLLVPYYWAGRKLVGLADMPIDVLSMKAQITADPIGFLKNFWLMILGAILVWLVSIIPLYFLLNAAFNLIFTRMKKSLAENTQ